MTQTPLPPIGAFGTVRTPGFVGTQIRLFTRSRVNHAFVYIGVHEGQPSVVEAHAAGARISPLSDRYRNDGDWSDELSLHIAQEDGRRGQLIADAAISLVGCGYGFLDILALGLAQFGVRIGWLRRWIAQSDRLICSQLVDKAYYQAGVHLFPDHRWPQDVTPGDLDQLIAAHRWWTVICDKEERHA